MNTIAASPPGISTPAVPLRWLPLGGVLGPLGYTVAWLVLGMLSPGYTAWGVHIAPYSPISQSISGLGLGVTAPYMNAAFVLNGVLMLLAAIGIAAPLPRSRRTVFIALALPGIGSILDGVFTLESFLGHTAGFALALTSIIGFPLTGALVRRLGGWTRISTCLLAAGPLTLVLAIAYFVTFSPTPEGALTGVAGLTERLLVLELQLWYAVLGWRAFRHT
ncbi:MAG TPA: DUF998 domain-containing protein [Chloroflexota bacterium]|nr:DUF998 domain-containing protein [Chloroflexota bacterium]